MERIKRFKDFNESQDPTASSTMSMQNNGAASGNLKMDEPFTTQRIMQTKIVGKITDPVVKEITKDLDEEETEEDETERL